MLKAEGYVTGIVGKWHLGQENQSIPPNQGFDVYRVGILETTDGTMYAPSMRRNGMSEAMISKAQPHIYESSHGTAGLEKVREYTLEYRRFVERDIAGAAAEFIREMRPSLSLFSYMWGGLMCTIQGLLIQISSAGLHQAPMAI